MFVGACLLCACALSLAPTNVGGLIRYDIFAELPGFKNVTKSGYTLTPLLHVTGDKPVVRWQPDQGVRGIDNGGERWSFSVEVNRQPEQTIDQFSFRCERSGTGNYQSFEVNFIQAHHEFYVYRYDNIPINNATIADGTHLARDPPVKDSHKGCTQVFEPVKWAKCGSNYVHATNGTITSPFYPRYLPTNLECVWQLTGPTGYRFVLTITDFKLGKQHCEFYEDFNLLIYNGLYATSPVLKQDCEFYEDYNLVMYNGLYAKSPVLVAFCGTRFIPKANEEVTSQFPGMRVLFRTKKNSPNMKGGVRITYKREATTGEIKGSDCYEPRGKPYTGTTNVTVDGFPCQRWNADKPHTIYPPMYRKYPENYCRNPSGDRPTCVSTNPNKYFAYCDVPPCPKAKAKTSGAVQPSWVCTVALLCVSLRLLSPYNAS